MIKYRHTYKIVNPTQYIKSTDLDNEEDIRKPNVVENNLKAQLENYVLEHFNEKEDILYYVTDSFKEYTNRGLSEITYEGEYMITSFKCIVSKYGDIYCSEITGVGIEEPFHSFKISITNEKIDNKKK